MISGKKLELIKRSFSGKRIVVIGDMMLDGYYWGDVKRISPEAPVPVVEISNEFHRFGGAANVALNIATLGGIPIPIGVIGNDNEGEKFKNLLAENKITSDGIFTAEDRPTTLKIRVIAQKHHLVRIDKESKKNISPGLEKKILNFLDSIISEVDAVILQDYNKGVLTSSLINQIIKIANDNSKIVTVDPKFENFLAYKNVSVFKPNKKETEDALGIRLNNEEEIIAAGNKLLKLLKAKNVLLTLGDKGMILFNSDNTRISIPTKARKVADVSGAGDTVIATLTIALTAEASIEESALLANYAAGLVCEHVGIIPIELEKLFNYIQEEIK